MKKLTPRQINTQRKKDGKPPLNFRLLRRLIKKLETNPEAYNQGVWGQPNKLAPCGTAACIAGWACFLNGDLDHKQLRRNPKSVQRKAAKAIGLKQGWWPHDETALFAGDPPGEWLEPFGSQFGEAVTAKQQARVAVRYLKHIITTGEITSGE